MKSFRWPWISRKRAEQEMADAVVKASTEAKAKARAEASQRYDAMLEELRAELSPVIERFAHTRVHRPENHINSRTVRIAVDFQEQVIHEAFAHGSDGRAIEFVAEMIGRQAAQAIRAVNFVRPLDTTPETARWRDRI